MNEFIIYLFIYLYQFTVIIKVDHAPVKPAFGYRFEMNHQTIVVSGDTCKCSSLIKNSLGADILVQEVLCCDFVLRASQAHKRVGNEFQARLMKDILIYHSSVQDCIDIANAAKVDTMLFTHLVPAPNNSFMKKMVFGACKRPKSFENNNVFIGEDGMIAKVCSFSEQNYFKKNNNNKNKNGKKNRVEIVVVAYKKQISIVFVVLFLLNFIWFVSTVYTGLKSHKIETSLLLLHHLNIGDNEKKIELFFLNKNYVIEMLVIYKYLHLILLCSFQFFFIQLLNSTVFCLVFLPKKFTLKNLNYYVPFFILFSVYAFKLLK
jgi:hypothetical protein